MQENDGDPIQQGLVNHHKHFLLGEINYETVGRAMQWIVYEHTLPQLPEHLTLYVNSSGGDLYNAFALIDVMHSSTLPIYTVGVGQIMSAAAMIFICGARGHRYLARHTGIMMHQFYSELEGKEHELEAGMRELKLCRNRIDDILHNYCQISDKDVRKKLLEKSDVWMTANEAIKLKLADGVFTKIL